LSQTGVESGLTDVPPKHTQDFAVIHSLRVSNDASIVDTG
jgi:hypothetical protein